MTADRRQVRFGNCSTANQALIDAVTRVMSEGQFIMGTEVSRFASVWADYCGVSHCVPTASGSAALTASLKATRHLMKMPDAWNYVVVPAYSFVATAFSVIEAGFKPIYCDIDKNGLIDWDHCQDILGSYGDNVAAVIPVHLYGQVTEVPQVILDRDIVVIEDACQAHGYAGVQGHVACYSFYPSKNLGAAGDAGAVVTHDADIAMNVYRYINYGDGPGEKYSHSTIGSNQRMDAIQAAFLRAKMELLYLDTDNAIRAKQAAMYTEAGIATIASGTPNYYHLYPITAQSRQAVRERLETLGVSTGNHYPYTLPEKVAPDLTIYPWPTAFVLSERVVTLPIGPHLDEGQIRYVCDALTSIAEYDGSKWVLRKGGM